MIKIDENSYILCYLYAGNEHDCYSCLVSKTKDEWILINTHKYNQGCENERSNQYVGRYSSEKTESEILEMIEQMYERSKGFFPYSDMFLVQGDLGKFMEIAKNKDYLNIYSEN